MDDRDRAEFDALPVTMMPSRAILSPHAGFPRDSDALTFVSFITIRLRGSTMTTSCMLRMPIKVSYRSV